MTESNIRYLLFDIESVADGELISKIRYSGENLSPGEAVKRYGQERLANFGSEFIPYTYHIPVSIAIIKIAGDFNVMDIVTLDDGEYRPHVITKRFWEGWSHYNQPTLISFNGRTFDIPLMELAAFRYGVCLSDWFFDKGPSYEHPRNRYNNRAHLDLQEVITNFGATRFNGGLNLAANILGKPGKMEIAGHMVQELFDDGQIERINDYCRCDVLDTYFVFLRTMVLYGNLEIDEEAAIVEKTKNWLLEQSIMHPIYNEYLDKSNDWENPWIE